MATLQTVSRAKDKQFRCVGVTADYSFSFPAGHCIRGIFVFNRTANAITGGLNIGTAAAGAQVISAKAVGANALIHLTDAEILKRVFSLTAAQTLYVNAASAWNSANIDVFILAEKLRP